MRQYGVGPDGVLSALAEEIEKGGKRLTELNNKIQVAAQGGVRRIDSARILQWISRTMVKRDTATETQRVLHLARAEIVRLREYIAYKADNEDWVVEDVTEETVALLAGTVIDQATP